MAPCHKDTRALQSISSRVQPESDIFNLKSLLTWFRGSSKIRVLGFTPALPFHLWRREARPCPPSAPPLAGRYTPEGAHRQPDESCISYKRPCPPSVPPLARRYTPEGAHRQPDESCVRYTVIQGLVPGALLLLPVGTLLKAHTDSPTSHMAWYNICIPWYLNVPGALLPLPVGILLKAHTDSPTSHMPNCIPRCIPVYLGT
eukprot:2615753-Pyramimonas_sp.AAC.1